MAEELDDEPLPGETVSDNIAAPVEIPTDPDLIAQMKHEDLINRYQTVLMTAKKYGIENLDVILSDGENLADSAIEKQCEHLEFVISLMKKNQDRIIALCNVSGGRANALMDDANRASFAAGQSEVSRPYREVGKMETAWDKKEDDRY